MNDKICLSNQNGEVEIRIKRDNRNGTIRIELIINIAIIVSILRWIKTFR
jgi:hypothetical protein